MGLTQKLACDNSIISSFTRLSTVQAHSESFRSEDAVPRRVYVTAVTALAVFIGGAFAFVANVAPDSLVDSMGLSSTLKHAAAATSASKALAVDEEGLVHSNDFERRTGRKIGNGIYPHSHLTQAGKETLFTLKSGVGADWHAAKPAAEGEALAFAHMGTGSELAHVFEELGCHTLRATRKVDGGQFVFQVDVRVVRYELRELSDHDREKSTCRQRASTGPGGKWV